MLALMLPAIYQNMGYVMFFVF